MTGRKYPNWIWAALLMAIALGIGGAARLPARAAIWNPKTPTAGDLESGDQESEISDFGIFRSRRIQAAPQTSNSSEVRRLRSPAIWNPKSVAQPDFGIFRSRRSPAAPQTSASIPDARALRIATMEISPFVFKDDGILKGFSVEVWDQIAGRLKDGDASDYEWAAFGTIGELFQAVEGNQVDLGIAAISMTPEREALLDFSHSYFDSGLQILTQKRARPSFLHGFFPAIRLIGSPFLLEVILFSILAGILMAHAIWLVERRATPNFPKKYFAGVWEGAWWLMQIIAAGSYRNPETKSVVTRLMTACFWVVGVALVAEFTAALTSALTVQQLSGGLQGPADLPGRSLATLNDSTAAEYLSSRDLEFTGVDQIEAAYDLLLDGKVEAVVFDAPALAYYAKHQDSRVELNGPIFHPEKYGIALPINSPLREGVNQAILEMYQDGTMEQLQQKWFGQ